MIVRPRPSPLNLLLAWRGTILPRVLPQVLGVAALSCGVVWVFHQQGGPEIPRASPAAMSLLGIALSIFLGFRNSACYERWWEARKVWGTLLVELRSLSRDAIALLDDGQSELPEAGQRAARRLIRRNIAFAYTLAAHLRGQDAAPDLKRLLTEAELERVLVSTHRPGALLREHSLELASLLRAGQLSDIAWSSLTERLHSLSRVLAACERIRLTPLPFSYTVLLHRTAYLFCLLLPFGLADSVGWFTPVVAALVAYTFFGLDRLGDELEEPFGQDPNDLPLLALARTAEINLSETLGEPLPEPMLPEGFVLP